MRLRPAAVGDVFSPSSHSVRSDEWARPRDDTSVRPLPSRGERVGARTGVIYRSRSLLSGTREETGIGIDFGTRYYFMDGVGGGEPVKNPMVKSARANKQTDETVNNDDRKPAVAPRSVFAGVKFDHPPPMIFFSGDFRFFNAPINDVPYRIALVYLNTQRNV